MLIIPGDANELRVLMRMLVACAFLHRPLAKSWMFWLIVFAVHFWFGNIMYWHIADNHKYLFSYWYLAIGCCFFSRCDMKSSLSFNGRVLIGLVFLYATVRKVFAPDYLCGDTFLYLLYNDSRFGEVAHVIGRLTITMDQLPRTQMRELVAEVDFPDAEKLRPLVAVLTWWTVIIEGLIALLFLWNPNGRLRGFKNFLLMAFIVAVYPIAPVIGFATILLILAYAQCDKEERLTRLAYLFLFVTSNLILIPEIKTFSFDQLESVFESFQK